MYTRWRNVFVPLLPSTGYFIKGNDMNAEQKHIAEIERIKKAIKKTNSRMLKRDYVKHLHDLEQELREYRNFRKEARC